MSRVHVLPPEIVSKIAAGEVIERPASVVKELVENALDAHAESIEISLKRAGKSHIKIKDTGTGIEPDDIKKIFSRHSTSKIHNISDLNTINSLGFRGEALYSIAAIADVVLRSKTTSSDTGWEIHLRGGKELSLKPISMTEGTEIEVNELFFNTPGRRKFLKSDTTELHQILNTFIPYSLLYPGRRFFLTHYDSSLLDLPPEQGYIDRVVRVLNFNPEHILEKEEEFSDKGVSIRLVLGDINIQRTRKDLQFVFVNQRPVRNHIISYHLNQVYKLIFPAEVYPFFAVYITLPAENVDVNIHPTKREVKIITGDFLISLLRSMCEHTLMSYGKAKQMERILPSLQEYPNLLQKPSRLTGPDTVKEPSYEQSVFSYAEQLLSSEEEMLGDQIRDNLKNKLSTTQYIGPFRTKYLLFESGTSLIIIDQHAAHERVTYEYLLRQIKEGRVEVQHLLTPIVIQVSPQEKLLWEELKDKLEGIGISTTLWDNENVALHTHPQLIKRPEIALRNLLSEDDSAYIDTDTLARRACRNSVMAGNRMASEEALHLRNELAKCKDPFTCPHGRPTLIEIKDHIFEKQFLRK